MAHPKETVMNLVNVLADHKPAPRPLSSFDWKAHAKLEREAKVAG